MTKFKKALATLMAVACTASALCVPMSISAAGTNTTTISETENNNSISTADNLSCNNIMSGAISSSSDVDYYSYFAPATGYIDIQLGVSATANYDIVLYNSNGNVLATSNTNGNGYGESIRYYVSINNVYYIKVYPHSTTSSYSGAYNLYVSYPYSTTNTWYPQINAVATDTYTRWNTYKLDNLYYNNGTSKPFMINDSTNDYMYQGCAIASVAMVLHNLNAKTVDTIVDFRTGFKGHAFADPFTVAMANISATDSPEYTNSRYNYNTSQSVIAINSWAGIASKFGKTANTSHTATWTNAVSLVSSYPQGVIVKFRKYITDSKGNTVEKPHYVVLTKASNTEGYLIYDAGKNNSSANGKTWNNSYTSQNYSPDQVVDVITIS